MHFECAGVHHGRGYSQVQYLQIKTRSQVQYLQIKATSQVQLEEGGGREGGSRRGWERVRGGAFHSFCWLSGWGRQ